MLSDEITVSGISFNHGTNGEYEFYAHTDRAPVEGQADADGDQEPSVLLCGLAGLIRSGELPKYESYQANVIAPVVNAGENESTIVDLHVECGGCRQLYALRVERADYDRLLNRTECIQEIFPYLPPPMRELLVSGTCPKCWKQMFGAEDTSAETHGNTLDIDKERD